ncbi:MAG: archease [Deltaproteobacteria bacterium]|nr:archease [Deltaproteobacteria bacterium]
MTVGAGSLAVATGSPEATLRAARDLVRMQDPAADVGGLRWAGGTASAGLRTALSPPRVQQALGLLPMVTVGAARLDAAPPLGDRFETVTLDHTADEGFVVRARHPLDLLCAAAEALGALMVDPVGVRPAAVLPVEPDLAADAPDDERLSAWLGDVLFLLDSHRWALARAVVLEDRPHLCGLLLGEPWDEGRHHIHGAVKAVTWHALEVAQEPDGGWRAQMIVDV